MERAVVEVEVEVEAEAEVEVEVAGLTRDQSPSSPSLHNQRTTSK